MSEHYNYCGRCRDCRESWPRDVASGKIEADLRAQIERLKNADPDLVWTCMGCELTWMFGDLEQVQPDGHYACPTCPGDPPLTTHPGSARKMITKLAVDEWLAPSSVQLPDGALGHVHAKVAERERDAALEQVDQMVDLMSDVAEQILEALITLRAMQEPVGRGGPVPGPDLL